MSFAPFFMSDEEEDARLALQDTDIGAISPTFSNLTPPTMSPDQLPTPELERLAAMEQLGQFGQPQVDYSQIPDYYGQAQERWAQAAPDRGQIQPGSYVLDAMAAKIPQGVKDFEPTTFMSTGQTSGQDFSPSLGQLSQFAFPQSGSEIPFEFLPFDEALRHGPDAFEAMVKAFHPKALDGKPIAKAAREIVETLDIDVNSREFFNLGVEEPDEFFYHVTTKPTADKIREGGFAVGERNMLQPGVAGDGVFFTESDGLPFWVERAEAFNAANFDNPPDIEILRVRKSKMRHVAEDAAGSRDARARAVLVKPEDIQ